MKIKLTESELKDMVESAIKKCLKESINNQNYTHFAVQDGKIINGWDYNGYEPDELKMDKKYYFYDDMADAGLNPKQYKIYTKKFLEKHGIDPNDDNNWMNPQF
jgi:predicted peptidase